LNDIFVNSDITAPEIRLVHEGQSTVISTTRALELADQFNLDLIQITEADVPVCKFGDFAKYLYDKKQEQKLKDKKTRQGTLKVKEIQLSLEIQENDLNTKIQHAVGFIDKMNQVQVSLRLLKAQQSNKTAIDLAINKVKQFITSCGEVNIVRDVTMSGNQITATIKSIK
jgi:translation initiation factor IF-3